MLTGCWSHSRRKFYELHASEGSKIAIETVELMANLWQVEEAVRGQIPDVRVATLRRHLRAVVSELFDLWQKTLPRISGKSKLQKRSAMPAHVAPSSSAV